MAKPKTAAFFRVEGTLIDRGALAASAYFASNCAGLCRASFRVSARSRSARRSTAFSRRTIAPSRRALPMWRCATCRRTASPSSPTSTSTTSSSERIYERGKELVKQARKDGHRVVLLSEGIEQVVAQAGRGARRRRLRVQSPRVQARRSAPASCSSPSSAGTTPASGSRATPPSTGFDLAHSVAYAAHGADLLLLSAVGRALCGQSGFRAARRSARCRLAGARIPLSLRRDTGNGERRRMNAAVVGRQGTCRDDTSCSRGRAAFSARSGSR